MFITIALSGTTSERKTIISSTKLRPEHENEHARQPGVDRVVVVELLRRVAGHEDLRVRYRRTRRGISSLAQLADGIDRPVPDRVASDSPRASPERVVAPVLQRARPVGPAQLRTGLLRRLPQVTGEYPA